LLWRFFRLPPRLFCISFLLFDPYLLSSQHHFPPALHIPHFLFSYFFKSCCVDFLGDRFFILRPIDFFCPISLWSTDGSQLPHNPLLVRALSPPLFSPFNKNKCSPLPLVSRPLRTPIVSLPDYLTYHHYYPHSPCPYKPKNWFFFLSKTNLFNGRLLDPTQKTNLSLAPTGEC